MNTVIPAIDLKGGQCVRLTQGLAEQETVYSGDPVAMARHWVSQGAEVIHVVDLDGAFAGRPMQTDIIGAIASEVAIPVEVGGGLRSIAAIRQVLIAGAARAIVGTWACERPEALRDVVGEFGDRVAVGIDSRDGMVQVKGWLETAEMAAIDMARRADSVGVKTLICTDTSVDGMMTGVNLTSTREMCEAVSCDVIASGGVASTEDIQALCALKRRNLVGVIVGKALYEERVTLGELMDAAT